MATLEDGVSVMVLVLVTVAVGAGVSVKIICVDGGGAGVMVLISGRGVGWLIVGWFSKAACAVMVATKSGVLVGGCPPGTLQARMVTMTSIEKRILFDLGILFSLSIEMSHGWSQRIKFMSGVWNIT
jgi:hypothetical protein